MNEFKSEPLDRRVYRGSIAPAPNKLSILGCNTCGDTMEPVRAIAKLGVLPELFVFHCPCCGSVEATEAHKHAA